MRFHSARAVALSMLPLLLLLLSLPHAFGQERDLQLTARVVAERYCAVGPEVDALQLTLRLRYANASDRKLILYRGNRLFYQVFISRGSGQGGAGGKNELRTSHSRFYDETPERIKGPSPGSVFVTLPPGGAYETTQVVTVPVAREGEGRLNAYIGAGEHDLQLVASTWYESKTLAQELRERWRRNGFLWADPVASNSVRFAVGRERQAAPCR